MNDKIIKNEIIDSFGGILKKRLTSPIYGVFLLSWLVFHWKFVFTMFFVSEERIWDVTGLLKSDYLAKTFFNFSDLWFYFLWVLPFLTTYLVIWEFPQWISLPAFKKEVEYEAKKRKIEIIEQRKLEEENVKKLEVVTQKVQKQSEIKKLDPTAAWREDYEQFKKSIFYHKFSFILDSVYRHNGWVSVGTQTGEIFEIPKDILVYSHTNDLIALDREKRRIELTEKGKFFVKLFSLENLYLLQ